MMPTQKPDGSGGEEPIHVLFCADRHYLQHTAVAAVSLLESSPNRRVWIHLATCERDPGAEGRLAASLAPYGNASFHIHRVNSAVLSECFVSRHLTGAAYIRLLAADLLPKSASRADLSRQRPRRPRRHRLALGGGPWRTAAGAVAELNWDGASARDRLRGLGLAPDQPYFNSGVLVIDLDRWRRDQIRKRLFDYVASSGSKLLFHDQDALNVVLQNDVRILDRRWNVQAMMYGRTVREAFPDFWRESAEARRRPALIHYTTKDKPWSFRNFGQEETPLFPLPEEDSMALGRAAAAGRDAVRVPRSEGAALGRSGCVRHPPSSSTVEGQQGHRLPNQPGLIAGRCGAACAPDGHSSRSA